MRPVLRYLQLLSLVVACLAGTQYTNGQNKRSVRLEALHAGQVRVLRPEGVAAVSPAAANVEIKRGELLFERVSQQAVVTQSVGGVSRNELPFRLYGVRPDGGDLNLGVVVDVEGGGMRPTPNAAGFVGKLRFGIIDKQSPDSRQTLPTPVNFQVTADVDSVSPDAISLNHTNLPFAPLTLSAVSPGDTVSVQIRPSFAVTEPVKVDLSVIRPELSIQVSPSNIQGWGLEEADITIEATGMEHPENTRVTLNATKGGLDRTVVSLDKGGLGTAKIRSIGLGSARVTAESPSLKGTDRKLEFTPPWAFAIAAILGAVVGVVGKKLGTRSKGKILTIAALLAGVALGVLAAVAFAVGVNLTGYVPQAKAGEAVTFFVAGIVAYAGGFTKKTSDSSST